MQLTRILGAAAVLATTCHAALTPLQRFLGLQPIITSIELVTNTTQAIETQVHRLEDIALLMKARISSAQAELQQKQQEALDGLAHRVDAVREVFQKQLGSLTEKQAQLTENIKAKLPAMDIKKVPLRF